MLLASHRALLRGVVCQGNFGPEKLGPRDQYSTKIVVPLDRDFQSFCGISVHHAKKHKLDLKIYIDCIQVQDKVYSYNIM